MKNLVFIIEDEPSQRKTIQLMVEHYGYETKVFEDAKKALKYFDNISSPLPDLVLADIQMSEINCIQFTNRLQSIAPQIPIIILTANANVSVAVSAMKAGAKDFIEKPIEPTRLKITMDNIIKLAKLSNENSYIYDNIGQLTFDDIFGKSSVISSVIALGKKAAISDIPVIIEGESGVGKEVLARAIHGSSKRAKSPFVRVDCSALSDKTPEQAYAQLFGRDTNNDKGNNTPDSPGILGKIIEAQGGTVYFDEVSDLSTEMQAEILKLLKTAELNPQDSDKTYSVDVRIISATKDNLEEQVKNGYFMEDLFYRLHVFPIFVPPLRDRRKDIRNILMHYLNKFTTLESKTLRKLRINSLENYKNINGQVIIANYAILYLEL